MNDPIVTSPGSLSRAGRRLRLPSPALVVASIALLLALGGTGYAAVTLPANSVGPVQIRPGAVSASEVRNGSLGAIDLSAAARKALTGAQGPKGEPGAAGLSGFEVVYGGSTYDSSRDRTVVLDCPPGKHVIGGGAAAWGRAMIWIPHGVAVVVATAIDENTWLAKAQEIVETDGSWFLQARAVCATAG